MASLKPGKKDVVDKRLQNVLECARRACQILKERAAIPPGLEPELESHIKRSLPVSSSSGLASKSSDLDSLGTQLWNAATNIIRAEENERDAQASRKDRPQRIVVLFRVFAFLLLDAAHHPSSRRTKHHEQRVRIFKLGLKACRFCLDNSELELAMKALERCSEYAGAAEEDVPVVQLAYAGGPGDGDEAQRHVALQKLVAEYYLLRMAHACKTERFDMADHFFSKLNMREVSASAGLCEKAADLFHEAGKALAATQSWAGVVKWCERAISALDNCNVEDLSHDAPELRLAVTATLVDALLFSNHAESAEQAMEVVNQLEGTHGMSNRIAVSLMRYQVITAQSPVDINQITAVLAHIIRIAVLTDKSFKTIMQTIHKTKKISVRGALIAIESLVFTRLLPNIPEDDAVASGPMERLEKALVTYVLFATSQAEMTPEDIINALRSLFDRVSSRCDRALSAKATHAAQTLIWKKVGLPEDAQMQDWCSLLRHPIFDGAGQINKARIGRKSIAAALASSDTNAARETFHNMPLATRNEITTRYLMFKVALHDGDYDLADECLVMINKHADRDPSFLYACVLEAQQSDMRHIAVAALRGLVDKLPHGVHLPSLLRCTVRLMIGELDGKLQPSNQTAEEMDQAAEQVNQAVEEVVLLFERAADNTEELKRASGDGWRTEIQWWSKNAYNLALRLCSDIHPTHLQRLLQACTKLMEHWPSDGGPMHQQDIARRKMLCHFLCATTFIVLARSSEEDTEYSLQSYLQARHEIADFMKCLEALTSANNATDKDTLARKFEMLKFDMECVLRLQQWDHLNRSIQDFLNLEGVDRWDSLADLVLISHNVAGAATNVSPTVTARLRQLLQKCINQIWKSDRDIIKMARWLRLAFQLNVEDGDTEFALTVLQQATAVARKGDDTREYTYPVDELGWLATTAFNRGVDALTTGLPEMADKWILDALELARYADDRGSLHANLHGKHEAAKARTQTQTMRA